MPESRGYRDAIPTLPAGSGAALGIAISTRPTIKDSKSAWRPKVPREVTDPLRIIRQTQGTQDVWNDVSSGRQAAAIVMPRDLRPGGGGMGPVYADVVADVSESSTRRFAKHRVSTSMLSRASASVIVSGGAIRKTLLASGPMRCTARPSLSPR